MKFEYVELDNLYCFIFVLEEGFFFDVVIKSKSGREVCKCFRNILIFVEVFKKI